MKALIARALRLAACLLLAAADAPLFPQAADKPEPDFNTTLHLPGGRALRLESVHFKPAAGLSEAAIPGWCGVVVHVGSQPPQALVAIGTGHTALVTCDGVSEAGLARMNGGTTVVAMIYNTSTPGGLSTAPIILIPAPDGTFRIDDGVRQAARHGADLSTLAALRKALLAIAP